MPASSGPRGSALTLWEPLDEAPFFRDLAGRLARGERRLGLTGLVAESRALILSLLVARTNRSLMVVR